MDVTVLSTGGTIASTGDDGKTPTKAGEELLDAVPELSEHASFSVERVASVSGFDMTFERATALRHAAERAAIDSDGIVVTHGTDTMVRTARTLEDALHSEGGAAPDKTVVLVGSLSPARFKSSDAVFNIGFATAAVQTLPPGVYLAMNGQVFRPGDVRKNHEANRFERPDAPEER